MSRKLNFYSALVWLASSVAAFAQMGTFTVLDAPGAGPDGTFGAGINKSGAAAGYYFDAHQVIHAFVRSATGEYTTFEALAAGDAEYQGTLAASINSSGAVAGYYIAAGPQSMGKISAFLDTASGVITSFNAPPGSGPYPQEGTYATSINDAGVITGYDLDRQETVRGFVRTPTGEFANFVAPGSNPAIRSGTYALAINNSGTVVGYYADENVLFHAFIRAVGGAITTFEAPGAGTTGGGNVGTMALAINDLGTVVGTYGDANNVSHGFARSPVGVFTIIDAPGAGTGSAQGTIATAVNDAGTITGGYRDANNVLHGFVLTPAGMLTEFDAPDASTTAFGTEPLAISNSGAITGTFLDSTGLYHGFIVTPKSASGGH